MPKFSRFTNRQPIIGVLASWPVYAGTLNTLLNPILHGIYEASRAYDCNLLIGCGVESGFSTSSRTAWPLITNNVDFVPVGEWNTDGLIVIAPKMSENAAASYIHKLKEAGFPLVFAESSELAPSVGLDNEGGIRQALEHLVSHGHRNVAFIGADASWRGDSLERLQAFYTYSKEFGLVEDPRLISFGQFTTPGGYAAMQTILDSGVSFSAVVAANDESAVGAMRALQEAGLHVPGDVALIGFDNRFEARHQTPPLASVHQPAYEIGWQSLELMLNCLEGDHEVETMHRVPTHLVIRESCGCHNGRLLALVPDNREDWIESISSAVFASVGQLHMDTIHQLSGWLLDGFEESVKKEDAEPFQSALQKILARLEPIMEDAHAWQVAIHILRLHRLAQGKAVLDWLDAASMQVSEFAQHQLLRNLARQNKFTQQLSQLSSELGETKEVAAIQAILDRHMNDLGIRHAHLVLFEADVQDPVLWSKLPGVENGLQRFLTRSFPPAGLFAEALTYQLALLPLPLKYQAGFIAFDTADLYPCMAVLRMVTSTLENIRLYREAAEARQIAEEANQLKSRFLSTVSHELRTPLNLIVGWSEMLLNQSNASGANFSRQIHASAQHLGRLIRDVLDLASSDAGQLRLTCEPLDMIATLQLVSETGRQMAIEKNLEWRVDFPAYLPRVSGDRTRLQQITLNLISNAIKFTAEGYVLLKIQAESAWVKVSVEDTGIGIAPGEQQAIFDEFRQSERTTARGYGGMGLGLSISKRLVEMHGGEVGVFSSGEEGAGSSFYYRLPVLDAPEPARNLLEHAVMILTTRVASGEMIFSHLQRAGFTVIQQLVDESPGWLSQLMVSPPGAVVMDEKLASKYGWELLKVFKGNPATAEIPVLFYALDGEKETGTIMTLDYLEKMVSTDELIKALTRHGWTRNVESESQTILVVDDEPGTLDMNVRMVQDYYAKARVFKARNGREALDFLSNETVQLVLLDLMMPEMDGFEVLAQIRERETTRETQVIVLTSKSLTEADFDRLNRGVARVMSKGLYSVQEILASIEETLAQHVRLGSESQRLARKAIVYIHEHFASPLTREDLANHVNASHGHLARCFRQETGLSPMSYLNRYRIRQAQERLTKTRQSITSVALACGFADINYFSRVFHQETGLSPLAYRRNKGDSQ